MTNPASDRQAGDGVTVDVLRGSPSDAEVAALLAVVSEAYVEEAAAAVAADSGPSAWALSQRALRTTLRRELGWGRWGG